VFLTPKTPQVQQFWEWDICYT